MILHTTEVTPLPGFRLFLRFNNSAADEVDLSAELSGEVFEALRDPALFATAQQHPVMRTAAWANGADLAPEFLLEQQGGPQGGAGQVSGPVIPGNRLSPHAQKISPWQTEFKKESNRGHRHISGHQHLVGAGHRTADDDAGQWHLLDVASATSPPKNRPGRACAWWAARLIPKR